MVLKAAFIFVAPDADPMKHRSVVNTPEVILTTVGVITSYSIHYTKLYEQFEQVRSTVFSRCNQQLVREKIAEGPLNIAIVYYSYSGITRGLMEKIHEICGGDLVEIHTLKKYRSFTAFTTGCLRSRSEEIDPITPDIIDVSGYDLLVIATPVCRITSYKVCYTKLLRFERPKYHIGKII